MPYVTFERENVRVPCNAGTNLRKLAKSHGISVYKGIWKILNCRGHGLCGTCEVEIPESVNLHPRTNMEEAKLKGRPFIRRLSCQVIIHGDSVVRTHPPEWVSK